MERKFYIDRLRIFLTVLVIFHHSAIAFGASGGWYYIVPNGVTGWEQIFASLCMTVDQSYFMSFFFLISAFFMPTSYDRKGFGKFVKDRLVRLGIPLLFYYFVVNPLLVYGIYFDKATTSVLDCFKFEYFGVGPMWFVFTLLVFEFSYAIYRKVSTKHLSAYFSDKFPSTFKILAFIIVSGLVAFAIRLSWPVGTDFFGLQLGYYSLYIFMYFAGVLACRKNWFDKMTLSGGKHWGLVAIAGLVVLMVKFALPGGATGDYSGGWGVDPLFYAMWEPWMCVGICYFLLTWSKARFNSKREFVLRLSADSYGAYIVHPIMVVSMTFLIDVLPIDPLVKIFVVTMLATTLAFGTSDLLRMMPGIKRVL